MIKPISACLKVTSILLFLFFSTIFTFIQPAGGSPLPQADGQDEATAWVQLEITNLHEEVIISGDPPVKESINTEINFIIYGFYTFVRHQEGKGFRYQAIMGRSSAPRMPQVTGLSVRQSHPCQDDQALIIGRETRSLSGGWVRPGWIEVEDAGGGRVRLHLTPSQLVDVETIECPREGCYNLFSVPSYRIGLGRIGENPEVAKGDSEEIVGYDLLEMDWKTLKKILEGGELTLTIPIDIEKVYQEDYKPKVAGDTVQETIIYRVKGWIGPPPEDVG
ncbi:MAG: hypothetical protein ACOC5S_02565 [Acidobacteriota bacterium]